ncbi:MAG: hypothetical protein NZ551_09355 [Microscillaceae bacterium]|nr:hypothetical protein [Microscillaceae bacterium]MDW8461407.1 hypothetical protein [Cytophagales bacterium]
MRKHIKLVQGLACKTISTSLIPELLNNIVIIKRLIAEITT